MGGVLRKGIRGLVEKEGSVWVQYAPASGILFKCAVRSSSVLNTVQFDSGVCLDANLFMFT